MPPTSTTSVDFAGRQAGVLEGPLARHQGLLDQFGDQGLELGPRQLDRRCFGPAWSAVMNGRLISVCTALDNSILAFLGGFLEPLQRQLVGAQVDAVLLVELVGKVVEHPLVEVLAAQEGVAVGRLDLEDAVADLEDRHVEGAAAKVVDHDGPGVLLVEAVGERRRGRFVDDALDLEAGDLAGVLGRLALAVVEIGGNGDHRLGDLLAEMGLGRLLHLLQDEGADLAGAVRLAARLDPGVAVVGLDDPVGNEVHVLARHGVVVATADQALDGEQRRLGIGDGLTLGGLAHEPLAVVAERDHGRRRPAAFGVLDDARAVAVHDRNTGVGRAEVDTDDLAHEKCSLIAWRVACGVHAAALRGDPLTRLVGLCEI